MNQRRYLRQVRVDIGTRNQTYITVENLRVSFDLRNEAHASPENSTVKVYNLAPESEAQIAEQGAVRVAAGYRDRIGILAEGDIRRIEQERSGNDRVTTLTVGGSDRSRAQIAPKCYEGDTLKGIVGDVVQQVARLRLGPTDVIPDEVIETYLSQGTAAQALTELLDPRGIEWYEVLGEIRFAVERVSTVGSPFFLHEGSGLIDSGVTNTGIHAKLTLTHEIELDQVVNILSPAVRGRYRTTMVHHRGDNWSGQFTTEIEAKEVDYIRGRSFL